MLGTPLLTSDRILPCTLCCATRVCHGFCSKFWGHTPLTNVADNPEAHGYGIPGGKESVRQGLQWFTQLESAKRPSNSGSVVLNSIEV